MASHPASAPYRPAPTGDGVLSKVVALFLGLMVAVVGFFALLMWADARDSRETSSAPVAASACARCWSSHSRAGRCARSAATWWR